ncbi:MAG: alpha/beta hydrolase [Kaistella sp.]|nr:alpha/beta hydrolase [Kaistella sp.]
MKRSVILQLTLIASLIMVLNSCSTRYRIKNDENGGKKIYNLKYGENKRNVMDVFLPAEYTPDTPLIMMFHGGAWIFGSKLHLRKVQKFLYRNNFPTASINYRLVNKTTTYKAALEDISKAVQHVGNSGKDWNLAINKIILLGESAGGHLALLYGYKNEDQVQKIISLSGPADFYSQRYRNSKYFKRSHRIFQKVVGEKYNSANAEAFKEASPVYQASNVPTLHFQGNRDFLVNVNQGLALDSALTSKNIEHRFVLMEKTGHAPRFSKKKRDSLIYPNILDFIKQ